MKALQILEAGLESTIQDLGRPHFFHLGVPLSGSVDGFGHRIANWLVGNDEGAAVIEMSLQGMRLQVHGDMDIAVCGAVCTCACNGEPIRQWEQVPVHNEDIVTIGSAEQGCRIYLAVTGGVDVPVVLGSRSTCLAGNFGGMDGRRLQAGDMLACGRHSSIDKFKVIKRCLGWKPVYSDSITARVIPGPHDEFFKEYGGLFSTASFTVSARSNRMGVRLQGPAIARDSGAPESILSEAVVPGCVQVPVDGQPIILLGEQTIGGYTAIATVLSIDLHKIAQAKAGDTVRFIPVSLGEAHQAVRQWTEFILEMKREFA